MRRLGYEKELLGFYITGHPLDDHAAEVAAFQIHTVAQLKETADEVETRLCGLVTKVEIRATQKDKKAVGARDLRGPDRRNRGAGFSRYLCGAAPAH